MKIIKVGAIWCKECLVMKPMWVEIEKEIPELNTEYFDFDMDNDKIKKYEIKNVPSFIFLDKEGQEFLRLNGVQNKDDLIKIIKDNIDK
ncbi:hypothetical protein A2331_02270 [Candidatus Falkowbacteria bacterium RIFOXYB2_FULL_34_18]|uniref:Thioredoxin domain-containing protein n=1 Tax=Candidatus Falkowbacteria bacterium RIFOXYD2_FULL_34_120 TaxID=1798007 RepID=A0A1F5TQN9_9BACT|nr:MAG: hypothetical protein A2331_02270 [Candidatus Falkowbacteria bacterium RIFOXYB2_FULL_34_18]OGF29508.1 MAG: hypothetical protein A2500_02260 [Candidatus Falkowbacteria bacterium RIFOXYC12_FULL_34_55]OGF36882.1 MAG: hypothetical protein A2466_06710 [Candidatus Falkowbacteria bacterium RIFOXYC2_FULL_34_220]OGF39081.1 MAG: hypothetical protein A2515_04715 [Candidatus Falkowbacteria bacterium RIFOXYD12_FULL_34_57]OGF41266.1 MAG: hypothetical protein A2531_00175 [Candidatus Falkowbacteria bact